jgi:ATP-dependent Clp protease protease subunit
MTKNKDFEKLKFWVESGVDIENRSLYICDVEDFGVDDKVRAISLMEKISNKPIHVYISSYGGSVYDGFALYDALKESGCKVHTYACGKAMSMGLIIFLAGDKRSAGENATFMAHQVSSVTYGKLSDLKADVEETDRINDRILNIFAKSTNKNKKWWKKETEHVDKFYDLKKAKELGILKDE